MPMSFRESQFIGWATSGLADLAAGPLLVGPGDDAAVLEDGTVICMDATVEGAHFEPGTPADLVLRKALGRPLSDLCAMGARAQTVHVAALLPPGCDGRALAGALSRWCRAFDVALAGGDTKRAQPGGLAFAVAATGRCAEGEPWRRSGARAGDRLVVSGPLGGARSGRHLRVTPRADVVAALRERGTEVHACLDLSDGLGRNLPQLCAASRVGAVIEADALPVHADVEAGRDRVLAALDDGEDFELLLAVPAAAVLPDGLLAIGTVTAGGGVLLRRDGRLQSWPGTGYEHEF